MGPIVYVAALTAPVVASSALGSLEVAIPVPAGGPYSQYTVTAKPSNGGPAVVLTSSSPTFFLTGLQPGVGYSLTFTAAAKSSGATTPVGSKMSFQLPPRCAGERCTSCLARACC